MAATLSESCAPARVRHRADTIFLFSMATRIISMQSGFAMLEAAYVRPMHAANIMMKNLMDTLLGALIFYAIGFQIAYGTQPAFLDDEKGFDWTFFVTAFSYATTTATIDSGALAGRVNFVSYLLLSMMMTGIIYPVAVSWVWGGGWLQKWGYHDFAGGSLIHGVGGMSALVCVCYIGPRVGRYRNYQPWTGAWSRIFLERHPAAFYRGPMSEVERKVFLSILPIHNPVQSLFLLFTGFLAFNPASALSTTNNQDLVVAATSAKTLLSTAATTIAVFIAAAVQRRSTAISVPDLTTALIGAAVSSCGCCDVVPPVFACVVGFIGSLLALST
eukprot:CAMPEP_0170642804 /NCGR_PEP_ID=MMETSP0224-20130122/41527_1 /TAXON_ID=285029 /ORGANISM="Togula jolla, Strain CCCM 725" /LENGTH=330 /DNA_ID=CAMNT_0010973549 /DNA_START=1 /DNA_END=989 /DNA_ORIENTATION=-